jgi:hypothetical protein
MITKNTRELIKALRTASSHPELHAAPQCRYYSLSGTGPLPGPSCGTSCCIAGDKLLRDYLAKHDLPKEYNVRANEFYEHMLDALGSDGDDPWDYAKEAYGLTFLEACLAFSPHTHYKIHAWFADVLERGLGLPYLNPFCVNWRGKYLDFQPIKIYWHDGSLTVFHEIEDLLDSLSEHLHPTTRP